MQILPRSKALSCLPFASTWVNPQFVRAIRIAYLLSFLCCPSMCLYILSSVLWRPLRFPYRNDVRFVLPPAVCMKVHVVLIMCVCLRIAMSNIYCVVFLFCLSLSCVPHCASFSGWFILDYPFGIL